jgi:lipoyl-dependent peroxiredoxin
MAIAQLQVIAERTAQTIWDGPLATGSGRITMGTGAVGKLPVTWASRTHQPDGMTSPDELAAAAHASCFVATLQRDRDRLQS